MTKGLDKKSKRNIFYITLRTTTFGYHFKEEI
jgi:hypothetical protein